METAFHPSVFHTAAGTPYLKEPGVVLINQPAVDLSGVQPFLQAFVDDGLDFGDYLADPTALDGATQVAKFAGQACYMSFGEKRTMNADAKKYFDNILSSGHGSVLHHALFTFLIYGGDRSFTHEQVRHGAGTGYSQESQRYVDGKVLRFCERPEYQADPTLHDLFEQRIDRAAVEYDDLAERLRQNMLATPGFAEKPRTEQRKAVNQAARSCLPNETEAIIVVSGNVRALRFMIEQRASPHADRPIRAIYYRIASILQNVAPALFGDYQIDHETQTATNAFRKV